MNKCEKNVRRLNSHFKRIKRLRTALWSVFLALLILLSVTGCSRLDLPRPENTSQPSTAGSERIIEELPALNQMQLLDEEQILGYTAAISEGSPDFDVLRPGGAADLEQLQSGVLERVVDGDTLIVQINGQSTRLRLIGIDAPESFSHHDETLRTVEGENVSRIVSALIEPGIRVWLQFDTEEFDKYDRMLAYVYLDEHTMLNELLARFGLVEVKSYRPNTYFHAYLKELEAVAKSENLGIWRSDSRFN
ncbi:MAG: hypothetical protein GX681_01315 [Clostridiaceae bacterium]|nr:hypothetical protein [Clostridiaceae bacterium]